MKFEHTLSPAMQECCRSAVQQLDTLRGEYLKALGTAKEIEMQSATLQQAIGQQLVIIQQTDGLPTPLKPYLLSADCTKMVGEIPDRPAAAPSAPIVTPIETGDVRAISGVNGLDHSGAADHA